MITRATHGAGVAELVEWLMETPAKVPEQTR